MNTDIVVIAAGVGITDRLEVKFGGVEIEPIEILSQRMYAVPYGASVVIKNITSDYNFDLYFYMSNYPVKRITAGSQANFLAVRDIMIKDVPTSTLSEE